MYSEKNLGTVNFQDFGYFMINKLWSISIRNPINWYQYRLKNATKQNDNEKVE